MQTAPAVARFGANATGRDFVVGDLHGMFRLLDHLLERVAFDAGRDRLFSVGDLCDRGPASDQVLGYLQQPWFHACLGNHGDMLLSALRGGDKSAEALWRMNGGDWGLALDRPRQRLMVGAFSSLPLAMEVDTPDAGHVGIVHAEVPPAMDWPDFIAGLEAGDAGIRNHALWGRSRISALASGTAAETVVGVDLIFCGHTILGEPRRFGNIFYLDTGAFLCGRGRLSLVEIGDELRLTQAGEGRAGGVDFSVG